MTTAVKALTARIPHRCDSCCWTPSIRDVPTILPGHRYLRHTAFPDGEHNTSDRPYSVTECVECAEERDSTAGLLTAGACTTFCHGTVPCALPVRHDGDHSCRHCTNDTAAVA